MSVFEVLASDDAAQQERIAGTRAIIATQERVKERFEKFVSKARNDEDRETRLAMVEDQIRKVVAEVAAEYEFENSDHLFLAATSVLGGGHKPGCECGFCKNKGKLPGSKKDEEGDSDEKEESDDKDDDDKESGKPWEKDSSTNCDCGCANCKSGAHCSDTVCVETKHSGHPGNGEVSKESAFGDGAMGQGQQPQGQGVCNNPNCLQKGAPQPVNGHGHPCTECGTPLHAEGMTVGQGQFQNGPPVGGGYEQPGFDSLAHAVSLRESMWHDSADTDTGDTYVTDRVSLPSADQTGLGDTGAVVTDKSRVPAKGLKPIDVPSKMHPLEQQAIHATPDYGKELPGPSATGTSADVTTKGGPDHGDATKTWTDTKGFADPVTSRAAKWAVTE